MNNLVVIYKPQGVRDVDSQVDFGIEGKCLFEDFNKVGKGLSSWQVIHQETISEFKIRLK